MTASRWGHLVPKARSLVDRRQLPVAASTRQRATLPDPTPDAVGMLNAQHWPNGQGFNHNRTECGSGA